MATCLPEELRPKNVPPIKDTKSLTDYALVSFDEEFMQPQLEKLRDQHSLLDLIQTKCEGPYLAIFGEEDGPREKLSNLLSFSYETQYAVGPLGILDWPETIEFDLDPKCEWTGGRCPIPSQYVPVDPRWTEACRLMTIADTFMNCDEPDLAKCRYWTERANTALRRKGVRGRGWDTPASLDMGDWLKCCV